MKKNKVTKIKRGHTPCTVLEINNTFMNSSHFWNFFHVFTQLLYSHHDTKYRAVIELFWMNCLYKQYWWVFRVSCFAQPIQNTNILSFQLCVTKAPNHQVRNWNQIMAGAEGCSFSLAKVVCCILRKNMK